MGAKKLALGEKIVATFGKSVTHYNPQMYSISTILFMVSWFVLHQSPSSSMFSMDKEVILDMLLAVQIDSVIVFKYKSIWGNETFYIALLSYRPQLIL